ncbi:MAG: hypothetical protein VYE81_06640 [Planctomycetota bacterium]|nr:hypothetical protein [Planctomycetota bacterium]
MVRTNHCTSDVGLATSDRAQSLAAIRYARELSGDPNLYLSNMKIIEGDNLKIRRDWEWAAEPVAGEDYDLVADGDILMEGLRYLPDKDETTWYVFSGATDSNIPSLGTMFDEGFTDTEKERIATAIGTDLENQDLSAQIDHFVSESSDSQSGLEYDRAEAARTFLPTADALSTVGDLRTELEIWWEDWKGQRRKKNVYLRRQVAVDTEARVLQCPAASAEVRISDFGDFTGVYRWSEQEGRPDVPNVLPGRFLKVGNSSIEIFRWADTETAEHPLKWQFRGTGAGDTTYQVEGDKWPQGPLADENQRKAWPYFRAEFHGELAARLRLRLETPMPEGSGVESLFEQHRDPTTGAATLIFPEGVVLGAPGTLMRLYEVDGDRDAVAADVQDLGIQDLVSDERTGIQGRGFSVLDGRAWYAKGARGTRWGGVGNGRAETSMDDMLDDSDATGIAGSGLPSEGSPNGFRYRIERLTCESFDDGAEALCGKAYRYSFPEGVPAGARPGETALLGDQGSAALVVAVGEGYLDLNATIGDDTVARVVSRAEYHMVLGGAGREGTSMAKHAALLRENDLYALKGQNEHPPLRRLEAEARNFLGAPSAQDMGVFLYSCGKIKEDEFAGRDPALFAERLRQVTSEDLPQGGVASTIAQRTVRFAQVPVGGTGPKAGVLVPEADLVAKIHEAAELAALDAEGARSRLQDLVAEDMLGLYTEELVRVDVTANVSETVRGGVYEDGIHGADRASLEGYDGKGSSSSDRKPWFLEGEALQFLKGANLVEDDTSSAEEAQRELEALNVTGGTLAAARKAMGKMYSDETEANADRDSWRAFEHPLLTLTAPFRDWAREIDPEEELRLYAITETSLELAVGQGEEITGAESGKVYLVRSTHGECWQSGKGGTDLDPSAEGTVYEYSEQHVADLIHPHGSRPYYRFAVVDVVDNVAGALSGATHIAIRSNRPVDRLLRAARPDLRGRLTHRWPDVEESASQTRVEGSASQTHVEGSASQARAGRAQEALGKLASLTQDEIEGRVELGLDLPSDGYLHRGTPLYAHDGRVFGHLRADTQVGGSNLSVQLEDDNVLPYLARASEQMIDADATRLFTGTTGTPFTSDTLTMALADGSEDRDDRVRRITDMHELLLRSRQVVHRHASKQLEVRAPYQATGYNLVDEIVYFVRFVDWQGLERAEPMRLEAVLGEATNDWSLQGTALTIELSVDNPVDGQKYQVLRGPTPGTTTTLAAVASYNSQDGTFTVGSGSGLDSEEGGEYLRVRKVEDEQDELTFRFSFPDHANDPMRGSFAEIYSDRLLPQRVRIVTGAQEALLAIGTVEERAWAEDNLEKAQALVGLGNGSIEDVQRAIQLYTISAQTRDAAIKLAGLSGNPAEVQRKVYESVVESKQVVLESWNEHEIFPGMKLALVGGPADPDPPVVQKVAEVDAGGAGFLTANDTQVRLSKPVTLAEGAVVRLTSSGEAELTDREIEFMVRQTIVSGSSAREHYRVSVAGDPSNPPYVTAGFVTPVFEIGDAQDGMAGFDWIDNWGWFSGDKHALTGNVADDDSDSPYLELNNASEKAPLGEARPMAGMVPLDALAAERRVARATFTTTTEDRWKIAFEADVRARPSEAYKLQLDGAGSYDDSYTGTYEGMIDEDGRYAFAKRDSTDVRVVFHSNLDLINRSFSLQDADGHPVAYTSAQDAIKDLDIWVSKIDDVHPLNDALGKDFSTVHSARHHYYNTKWWWRQNIYHEWRLMDGDDAVDAGEGDETVPVTFGNDPRAPRGDGLTMELAHPDRGYTVTLPNGTRAIIRRGDGQDGQLDEVSNDDGEVVSVREVYDLSSDPGMTDGTEKVILAGEVPWPTTVISTSTRSGEPKVYLTDNLFLQALGGAGALGGKLVSFGYPETISPKLVMQPQVVIPSRDARRAVRLRTQAARPHPPLVSGHAFTPRLGLDDEAKVVGVDALGMEVVLDRDIGAWNLAPAWSHEAMPGYAVAEAVRGIGLADNMVGALGRISGTLLMDGPRALSADTGTAGNFLTDEYSYAMPDELHPARRDPRQALPHYALRRVGYERRYENPTHSDSTFPRAHPRGLRMQGGYEVLTTRVREPRVRTPDGRALDYLGPVQSFDFLMRADVSTGTNDIEDFYYREGGDGSATELAFTLGIEDSEYAHALAFDRGGYDLARLFEQREEGLGSGNEAQMVALLSGLLGRGGGVRGPVWFWAAEELGARAPPATLDLGHEYNADLGTGLTENRFQGGCAVSMRRLPEAEARGPVADMAHAFAGMTTASSASAFARYAATRPYEVVACVRHRFRVVQGPMASVRRADARPFPQTRLPPRAPASSPSRWVTWEYFVRGWREDLRRSQRITGPDGRVGEIVEVLPETRTIRLRGFVGGGESFAARVGDGAAPAGWGAAILNTIAQVGWQQMRLYADPFGTLGISQRDDPREKEFMGFFLTLSPGAVSAGKLRKWLLLGPKALVAGLLASAAVGTRLHLFDHESDVVVGADVTVPSDYTVPQPVDHAEIDIRGTRQPLAGEWLAERRVFRVYGRDAGELTGNTMYLAGGEGDDGFPASAVEAWSTRLESFQTYLSTHADRIGEIGSADGGHVELSFVRPVVSEGGYGAGYEVGDVVYVQPDDEDEEGQWVRVTEVSGPWKHASAMKNSQEKPETRSQARGSRLVVSLARSADLIEPMRASFRADPMGGGQILVYAADGRPVLQHPSLPPVHRVRATQEVQASSYTSRAEAEAAHGLVRFLKSESIVDSGAILGFLERCRRFAAIANVDGGMGATAALLRAVPRAVRGLLFARIQAGYPDQARIDRFRALVVAEQDVTEDLQVADTPGYDLVRAEVHKDSQSSGGIKLIHKLVWPLLTGNQSEFEDRVWSNLGYGSVAAFRQAAAGAWADIRRIRIRPEDGADTRAPDDALELGRVLRADLGALEFGDWELYDRLRADPGERMTAFAAWAAEGDGRPEPSLHVREAFMLDTLAATATATATDTDTATVTATDTTLFGTVTITGLEAPPDEWEYYEWSQALGANLSISQTALSTALRTNARNSLTADPSQPASYYVGNSLAGYSDWETLHEYAKRRQSAELSESRIQTEIVFQKLWRPEVTQDMTMADLFDRWMVWARHEPVQVAEDGNDIEGAGTVAISTNNLTRTVALQSSDTGFRLYKTLNYREYSIGRSPRYLAIRELRASTNLASRLRALAYAIDVKVEPGQKDFTRVAEEVKNDPTASPAIKDELNNTSPSADTLRSLAVAE